MKEIDAALLLLAGGSGTRIGGGKLFLQTRGGWLIEEVLERTAPLFSERLLVTAFGASQEVRELFAPLLGRWSVRVAEDSAPGLGPLEGLCRGLEAARSEWSFAIGCDMPLVEEKTVREMAARRSGADAAAAEINGFVEPLHAFYSKACLPHAAAAVASGKRRLKSFYGGVRLSIVRESELCAVSPEYRRSFFNINLPEDLAKYEAGDI